MINSDECGLDILDKPDWINWNCTNYPANPVLNKGLSYRKITNLWGGESQSGPLEWLSYFETTKGKAKSNVESPTYEEIPKYLEKMHFHYSFLSWQCRNNGHGDAKGGTLGEYLEHLEAVKRWKLLKEKENDKDKNI